MKVVVFGANGGVGREVVQQLLAAGHDVTAVVRRPAPTAAHDHLRTVAIPDLLDPDALSSILVGADAVLSGVGPRSNRDAPIASPVTASILAAMTRAGVRRLVAVSAAPVGDAPSDEGSFSRLILYPLFRLLLRPVFVDLTRMEAEMWASGLDCTAVRPPRLTNGPLTREYRLRIGSSVPRGTFVSRANTADAMIAALADDSTVGQPVGVAN